MENYGKTPDTFALIYCRVACVKQDTDGSGLQSQEHRCRDYAAERGYDVEAVFSDVTSGGDDIKQRPGIQAMLTHLDANEGKPYVVIFDDLKRFSRNIAFHFKLRCELHARGATVECLNFRFESTQVTTFIETLVAAADELERSRCGRQVSRKMRGRSKSS